MDIIKREAWVTRYTNKKQLTAKHLGYLGFHNSHAMPLPLTSMLNAVRSAVLPMIAVLSNEPGWEFLKPRESFAGVKSEFVDSDD